jgi:hypothetical protein
MCRGNVGDDALTYLSIEFDTSDVKNTAPAEVDAIEQYVRAHPDDDIGIITPFVNQRVALDDMVRRCGFPNVSCGTVHSFQGDEKDTVVFSLALTDKTHVKTYEWLANNRELINVATSRAKDKLVVVASSDELERLHGQIEGPDDLYELVGYVQSNGATKVQPRQYASRALGVKPFSTATETAFLETLDHALGNIFLGNRRHLVHKEVAISHVFGSGVVEPGLFFSGRFDFVVYERASDGSELPVLAIELDGAEHRSEEAVKARDQKKAAICRAHGLELIRVDNSYARRYNYIKDVLSGFFSKR